MTSSPPRLSISPAFVALLCGMIYLDGSGFTVPFLLSCALHEAGHLMVMRLFDLHPARIHIGLTGTVISTVFLSHMTECLAALAGPLMNAVLVLCFRRLWPQLALVSTLLFCYNMLPVYPLDGGRVLRLGLVSLFGWDSGYRLSVVLSWLTGMLMAAGAIYATLVLRLGLLPCLFVVLFLLRLPKWPCQTASNLIK